MYVTIWPSSLFISSITELELQSQAHLPVQPCAFIMVCVASAACQVDVSAHAEPSDIITSLPADEVEVSTKRHLRVHNKLAHDDEERVTPPESVASALEKEVDINLVNKWLKGKIPPGEMFKVLLINRRATDPKHLSRLDLGF